VLNWYTILKTGSSLKITTVTMPTPSGIVCTAKTLANQMQITPKNLNIVPCPKDYSTGKFKEYSP